VAEGKLANNTGSQLRLKEGQIVNIYDSGKVNVQGKKSESIAKLFQTDTTDHSGKHMLNPQVFVAYGHDSVARTQLEAMLRRWGLEPLILDQLPSEGQTIIEKLENYSHKVGFAVVLATPDDEGHKVGHPDEALCRARQNVVLELGVLLAKLGRKRVVILMKQEAKMERPSDIQGLIYIPFKDDLSRDAGVLLAKELGSQGYKIDVQRL
jgi:predicted nucleotide-binding protein